MRDGHKEPYKGLKWTAARGSGHKKWGEHFFHAVIQVTLASWPIRKRLEVGRTSCLQSKSDALVAGRVAIVFLSDRRTRSPSASRAAGTFAGARTILVALAS